MSFERFGRCEEIRPYLILCFCIKSFQYSLTTDKTVWMAERCLNIPSMKHRKTWNLVSCMHNIFFTLTANFLNFTINNLETKLEVIMNNLIMKPLKGLLFISNSPTGVINKFRFTHFEQLLIFLKNNETGLGNNSSQLATDQLKFNILAKED